MSVNRDKYKATSVSALKKQEKDASQFIRSGNNQEQIPWLEIEEGANKLRFFPAHEDSKSFIYPVTRVWLERLVSYEKNGQQVSEIKKKPIFNSRVHGGTSKDIVEEYIKVSTRVLTDEITDEEKLKEKLAILTHWQNGLKYNTEWISYAQKYSGTSKNFGRITIPNGIKNKMNEISIVEDVNDPISTDPFSHPDEGKAIIINKDSVAGKKSAKDYYKCSIEFRGNYTLTDKELEDFEKCPSLEKSYINVYKLRDFNLALEGLRIFDEKNEIGAIDHDDFLSVAEEIKSYYPEETEEVESAKKDEPTSNLSKLTRDELKKLIKQEGLSVTVKSSMSDDDIRNLILEAKGEEVLDETEEEEEEETEQLGDDLPADFKDVKTGSKASDLKSDVRAKLGMLKGKK